MSVAKYKFNQYWEEKTQSTVSVITPFYNRGYCLERVFKSVNNQTFRDFEYIVVDDGSAENNDSIVEAFMNSVDFPVMYIKKENGGVHTARNIAIKHSRGKYIVCIDSDDELVPEALQIMTDVWEEIPEDDRNDYFEVKFRCMNLEGGDVGPEFPDNLNSLPYDQRIKIYESIKGEHIGVRRGDIMRANPWPEPDGITFVTENVLWCVLRRKYKSYFSNKIARVYHTETTDSLTKQNRKFKSIQSLRNSCWNAAYYLNNKKVFYARERIHKVFLDLARYCIFNHILSWRIGKYQHYLEGVFNNFIFALLWLPSVFPAYVYMKKRVKE